MFTHHQSTLAQLDLEQLSSQVTKYSKYVNQLEKGLPRNNVVPSLKDKVEVMKLRVSRTNVPVVTGVCVMCGVYSTKKVRYQRSILYILIFTLKYRQHTQVVI